MEGTTRQPGYGAAVGRTPQAASARARLLSRLGALTRRRGLAVAVFLLVAGALVGRSYLTPSQYQAQARLLMDDMGAMSATPSLLGGDLGSYYRTQLHILRGPELAGRTLDRLGVDAAPGFPRGDGPAPRGPARADLARRIEVARVGETQMVDVVLLAEDPEFAATALNTHLEAYIDLTLDQSVADVRNLLHWVEQELATAERLVQESGMALAEFRATHGALTVDLGSARLTDLSARIIDAEQERVRREIAYRQASGAATDGQARPDRSVLRDNPAVREASAQLEELEAEHAALAARYGERHPRMIELGDQIDEARLTLSAARATAIAAIRRSYQDALAAEEALRAEMAAQTQAQYRFDARGAEFSVLQSEARAHARVHETLLEQQKMLRVMADAQTPHVSIVDPAEPPTVPALPNRRLDWLVALLAGVVVTFGVVAGLEALDTTLKRPEDLAEKLALPILGAIPRLPAFEAYPLLGRDVPDAFTEAFNALRTMVLLSRAAGDDTTIVGVTSTQPQEGKTTTACNLALTLASSGRSVLLIDADMRRPSVEKAFGVPNTAGLSDVLAGRKKVRDVVIRTHDPKLFVLPAGPTPPNPSELLTGDRMRGLVMLLENSPFEWVIVDTPPVLAVSDAVAVARLASEMVFVVGAEMTPSVQAARALHMLRSQTGTRVVGGILSGSRGQPDDYGYGYSGSYAAGATTERTAA